MPSKLEQQYLTYEVNSKFGVLDPLSQSQLAFVAAHLEHGPILEFGCWLGKSTFTLAKYKKPTVFIHTVDLFGEKLKETDAIPQPDIIKYYLDGNGSCPREEVEILQDLINREGNLSAVKHVLRDYLDTVKLYKQSTQNFVLDFEPEFAFIDAGHTYEECRSDIEKVIQKENCLIGIHDYDQEPVARAVMDMAKLYNRDQFVVGTMAWILDKDQNKKSLIEEIIKLANEH